MELETSLLVVGRVLLASLFVIAGIRHYFIAPIVAPMIAARGVPYPKLVLAVGSVFELIAGVLLMLGLHVFWAALALAAFTIAATIMLLNFWDMEGEPRQNAIIGFQSNVAILGGLLVAAATAT